MGWIVSYRIQGVPQHQSLQSLTILQAMLCHKMLVAARDGQEDFGEINHDQIKKTCQLIGNVATCGHLKYCSWRRPYQFRWIRISPRCWILVGDSSPGRVEEAAGKGFACWPEAVGVVHGNNHDRERTGSVEKSMSQMGWLYQELLWTNFLCQVFTMYTLENSHGTHFMEVRNMIFLGKWWILR